MIKPDEFKNWLDHPVTKKYLKYLEDLKEGHQEELLHITNSQIDHPLMLLGNFGGRIYLCDALRNVTHDTINDFYGESPNEEEEDA